MQLTNERWNSTTIPYIYMYMRARMCICVCACVCNRNVTVYKNKPLAYCTFLVDKISLRVTD